MPQLSTTVLNDGVSDVTFTPQNINNQGVATLVSRSGQPGVYHNLTIGVTGTEASGHSFQLKMGVPSVYTVPGTGEQVIGVDFASISIKLDKLGTTSSRSALRNLLRAALADTNIAAMIDNTEAMW